MCICHSPLPGYWLSTDQTNHEQELSMLRDGANNVANKEMFLSISIIHKYVR